MPSECSTVSARTLWVAPPLFSCQGGWAADRASPTAADPDPLRKIVVVFKTHFDIGYTDLAATSCSATARR